MSIVFIGTADETFTPTSSGAIATVMHSLARCAMEDGGEPLVIARRSTDAPFQDVPSVLFDAPAEPTGGLALMFRRVERKLAGWTRLRQGEWMREVARLLAEHRLADRPWVVANEPELAVYLRRLFPRVRLVHVFHNQLECKPAARSALDSAVDGVIAVSHFTSRWVERYYCLPPRRVVTVYNAVDHAEFAPAAELPAGKVVINFVGRTGLEKAPDLLLQACLLLSERTKDFSVQIVGSNHWDRFTMDAYQEELGRLVRALEERGIAVFQTGHIGRQDLPDYMRRAHIHVVPSRWDEPFGLTTLEGMATGLATVASDAGASREVVGDAGLIFRRDDARHLADILAELVLNPELRARYGAAARARAETFTWRRSWEQVREITGLAGVCTSVS